MQIIEYRLNLKKNQNILHKQKNIKMCVIEKKYIQKSKNKTYVELKKLPRTFFSVQPIIINYFLMNSNELVLKDIP